MQSTAICLPVLWMDTGEVSTLVAMALSLFLKNSLGLSDRWAMMAFASWKHTHAVSVQISRSEVDVFGIKVDSPPPLTPSCPTEGPPDSALLPEEEEKDSCDWLDFVYD